METLLGQWMAKTGEIQQGVTHLCKNSEGSPQNSGKTNSGLLKKCLLKQDIDSAVAVAWASEAGSSITEKHRLVMTIKSEDNYERASH